MPELSNDDINQKISEARSPGGGRWEHTCRGLSIGGSWDRSRRLNSESGFRYWHIEPRDWIGSEDASAILLEEMPDGVIEHFDGNWSCSFYALKTGRINITNKDRKRAIAMAWLKWRQI